MNTPNIHNFSLSEMFSDSTGKTCVSLVGGFMMITTGCIISLFVVKNPDTITATLAGVLVTGGSTLLGVRRFTKDEELKNPQINEEAK